VDADRVQAASGEEGSADTGVVSVDPDNAAGRRVGVVRAASGFGDMPTSVPSPAIPGTGAVICWSFRTKPVVCAYAGRL